MSGCVRPLMLLLTVMSTAAFADNMTVDVLSNIQSFSAYSAYDGSVITNNPFAPTVSPITTSAITGILANGVLTGLNLAVMPTVDPSTAYQPPAITNNLTTSSFLTASMQQNFNSYSSLAALSTYAQISPTSDMTTFDPLAGMTSSYQPLTQGAYQQPAYAWNGAQWTATGGYSPMVYSQITDWTAANWDPTNYSMPVDPLSDVMALGSSSYSAATAGSILLKTTGTLNPNGPAPSAPSIAIITPTTTTTNTLAAVTTQTTPLATTVAPLANPEPGPSLLVGCGLAVLGYVRLRRRKA